MPNARVFVSSTCYDLNVTRGQIRSLISRLGHIPVMSDFLEVLFDPTEHTHESCIREVTSCDLVVLLIGGRFGGQGIPKAVDAAAVDELIGLGDEQKKNLSITQLEVCKAIGEGVPVYTFVQRNVWHDHNVYELNKESPQIDTIRFPSIEKSKTAPYIFEFINFLRHRSASNSIIPYGRVEEIEEALKQQWSALFQRILVDRRETTANEKHDDAVLSEVADLRAAVMSALSMSGLREVAQGTRRFRLLLYFLRHVNADRQIVFSKKDFVTLLADSGIVRIEDVGSLDFSERRDIGAVAYIREGGYKLVRGTAYMVERVPQYSREWNEWKKLSDQAKTAIAETLLDDTSFLEREFIEGDYLMYRKGLAREMSDLSTTVNCVELRDGKTYFSSKTYELRGTRVYVREVEEEHGLAAVLAAKRGKAPIDVERSAASRKKAVSSRGKKKAKKSTPSKSKQSTKKSGK